MKNQEKFATKLSKRHKELLQWMASDRWTVIGVRGVAKEMGITYSRVYVMLNSLIKKGVVYKVTQQSVYKINKDKLLLLLKQQP